MADGGGEFQGGVGGQGRGRGGCGGVESVDVWLVTIDEGREPFQLEKISEQEWLLIDGGGQPKDRHRRSAKLPPGPYPFPIIGSILQLGQNPHQSLTKLSKIYGPLMHLKLGSVDTVVVSSPEMAKEILQTHDQAFPLRMTTAATRALDHHTTSVAFLPVGSQWRNLRKICKEHMFSTQRLHASQGLRQEKLQKLLQYVQECCISSRSVDIGQAAFVTSLNLISNTLFSVDFADYNPGSSQEIEGIVRRLMRVLGSPNLGDYFGFLGLFDPQGIKREAEFCMGKLLAIFDSIIDQRLEASRNSLARKTDLLDVLLEISEGNPAEFTRKDMKHLLLVSTSFNVLITP
ncbi:cytochrome [Sesamum alatum]|uniref:Cytochrome n=1 Tax=Sesamum alatum TaxID=300844 RepID=A0AAE1YF60_9LAMI|nr:cytochrome [Sesamum alatum]